MSQSRALVPLPQETSAQTRPFFFLATFWGKKFRDWFCLYAVQSLLAPNNIPALKRLTYARFLICTTREDWEALQKETVFKRLTQTIDVVFIENDALFPGEHKYHQMSRGHAILANECFKYFAIAININPDSIYPDGSVAEAERLAEDGKDVVMCTAVRFEMEGIRDELTKRGLLNWGHPLTISKRTAVDLGMRYLHAETAAADWEAPNFGRLAPEHERTHLLTCCFWRSSGEPGCIIITHNWSPFMVNYAALHDHSVDSLDGRAIDGDYIYENFGDQADKGNIHVVADSDSIFLLGLTPKDEMVPPTESRWWKNLPVIGEWSRGYILNQTVFDDVIDPLRRRLYRKKVRWHAGDITSDWNGVENTAERCIAAYATRDLRVTRSTGEAGRKIATTSDIIWRSPARALWFRAISTDVFRPYGAPNRLEFLRRKYVSAFKEGKFYIYVRAMFRAAKGDKMARNRIKNRALKTVSTTKKVAVAASMLVLIFLALNASAYFVLEHTDLMKNGARPGQFGSSAGPSAIQTGVGGIRYEPGWDDNYVRSITASNQNFSIVLGDGAVSGETIASMLNRAYDVERPAFLTVGQRGSNLTNNAERLFRLLRSGVRPKNVVFLVGWEEIFAKLEGGGREYSLRESPKPSRVDATFESLSLIRIVTAFFAPRGAQSSGFGETDFDVKSAGTDAAAIERSFVATLTETERDRFHIDMLSSFRRTIASVQSLAKGFDFKLWVFHEPIALLAPSNRHVPARTRQSSAYKFIAQSSRNIRETSLEGNLAIHDLSDILPAGGAPYYVDALTLSPSARHKIAQAIGKTMAARSAGDSLHSK